MIVPRRRGQRYSWSGLGAVSPIGYASFDDFQNAVVGSYPACPPPYDPTCENQRNASISADLNAWVTTTGDCRNVVCNAAGQPTLSYQPYTTSTGQAAAGYGYTTTAGFIPVGPSPGAPGGYYMPPATTVTPAVVVPASGLTISPGSQITTPIQSASVDMAPGGPSAPPTAPTPVQTQTPPTTPAPPAPTTFDLSMVPWWGWGIGAVVILMAVSGGKR